MDTSHKLSPGTEPEPTNPQSPSSPFPIGTGNCSASSPATGPDISSDNTGAVLDLTAKVTESEIVSGSTAAPVRMNATISKAGQGSTLGPLDLTVKRSAASTARASPVTDSDTNFVSCGRSRDGSPSPTNDNNVEYGVSKLLKFCDPISCASDSKQDEVQTMNTSASVGSCTKSLRPPTLASVEAQLKRSFTNKTSAPKRHHTPNPSDISPQPGPGFPSFDYPVNMGNFLNLLYLANCFNTPVKPAQPLSDSAEPVLASASSPLNVSTQSAIADAGITTDNQASTPNVSHANNPQLFAELFSKLLSGAGPLTGSHSLESPSPTTFNNSAIGNTIGEMLKSTLTGQLNEPFSPSSTSAHALEGGSNKRRTPAVSPRSETSSTVANRAAGQSQKNREDFTNSSKTRRTPSIVLEGLFSGTPAQSDVPSSPPFDSASPKRDTKWMAREMPSLFRRNAKASTGKRQSVMPPTSTTTTTTATTNSKVCHSPNKYSDLLPVGTKEMTNSSSSSLAELSSLVHKVGSAPVGPMPSNRLKAPTGGGRPSDPSPSPSLSSLYDNADGAGLSRFAEAFLSAAGSSDKTGTGIPGFSPGSSAAASLASVLSQSGLGSPVQGPAGTASGNGIPFQELWWRYVKKEENAEMRRITEAKQIFTCLQCHASFQTMEQLVKHMEVTKHFDNVPKQYSWSLQYARQRMRQMRVKMKYSDRMMYFCHLCQSAFSEAVQAHFSSVHSMHNPVQNMIYVQVIPLTSDGSPPSGSSPASSASVPGDGSALHKSWKSNSVKPKPSNPNDLPAMSHKYSHPDFSQTMQQSLNKSVLPKNTTDFSDASVQRTSSESSSSSTEGCSKAGSGKDPMSLESLLTKFTESLVRNGSGDVSELDGKALEALFAMTAHGEKRPGSTKCNGTSNGVSHKDRDGGSIPNAFAGPPEPPSTHNSLEVPLPTSFVKQKPRKPVTSPGVSGGGASAKGSWIEPSSWNDVKSEPRSCSARSTPSIDDSGRKSNGGSVSDVHLPLSSRDQPQSKPLTGTSPKRQPGNDFEALLPALIESSDSFNLSGLIQLQASLHASGLPFPTTTTTPTAQPQPKSTAQGSRKRPHDELVTSFSKNKSETSGQEDVFVDIMGQLGELSDAMRMSDTNSAPKQHKAALNDAKREAQTDARHSSDAPKTTVSQFLHDDSRNDSNTKQQLVEQQSNISNSSSRAGLARLVSLKRSISSISDTCLLQRLSEANKKPKSPLSPNENYTDKSLTEMAAVINEYLALPKTASEASLSPSRHQSARRLTSAVFDFAGAPAKTAPAKNVPAKNVSPSSPLDACSALLQAMYNADVNRHPGSKNSLEVSSQHKSAYPASTSDFAKKYNLSELFNGGRNRWSLPAKAPKGSDWNELSYSSISNRSDTKRIRKATDDTLSATALPQNKCSRTFGRSTNTAMAASISHTSNATTSNADSVGQISTYLVSTIDSSTASAAGASSHLVTDAERNAKKNNAGPANNHDFASPNVNSAIKPEPGASDTEDMSCKTDNKLDSKCKELLASKIRAQNIPNGRILPGFSSAGRTTNVAVMLSEQPASSNVLSTKQAALPSHRKPVDSPKNAIRQDTPDITTSNNSTIIDQNNSVKKNDPTSKVRDAWSVNSGSLHVLKLPDSPGAAMGNHLLKLQQFASQSV